LTTNAFVRSRSGVKCCRFRRPALSRYRRAVGWACFRVASGVRLRAVLSSGDPPVRMAHLISGGCQVRTYSILRVTVAQKQDPSLRRLLRGYIRDASRRVRILLSPGVRWADCVCAGWAARAPTWAQADRVPAPNVASRGYKAWSLTNNPLEMTFVEGNQAVEAFPPKAPGQSLAHRVGLGSSHGRPQDSHPGYRDLGRRP